MYMTIKEKQNSDLFEYSLSTDVMDLLGRLKALQTKGYCFRGQQDARWNIVSYAQRVWNEWRCRESIAQVVDYQHYLSMSLGYARRMLQFPSCNNRGKVNCLRDHEVWGYLQHYSWPTPFIDFSDSMDVALYMAVHNITSSQVAGHFSVYAINPEMGVGEENIDLDQWVKNIGEGDEEFYRFHKWGHIHTWVMHKNRASWCPEISKNRIASQGGMFVYLNSATTTLEDEFCAKTLFDKGIVDRIEGLQHRRIICIDVPYAIVPQIKAYLFDRGVSTLSLGLSDRQLDNEVEAKYKEFEEYFLENCNKFLAQNLTLADSCFIRSYDGDLLACCPHSGGALLVDGGQPLENGLLTGAQRIGDLMAGISSSNDRSFDETIEDYRPVLEVMNQEGLIVIGSESRDKEFEKCSDSQLKDNDVTTSEDPLNEFYAKHNLPRELHIDITNACTERCVHCYVPKGQRDFLPYELVEKALTEFREMNGLTVHLTGGEAMMHTEFERICRKCVELNLNFIIFSNMTLCDEKRVAFLKEVNPQYINVSLYSMDPDIHDTITQLPGSWQKTMDAILKCCEAGVACRIATPLLKENQDSLPELQKFADAHRMHLVPDADIFAQANHVCDNLLHVCSEDELRKVLKRDRGIFNVLYEGKMPKCDEKVCAIGTGGRLRLYLNAKGNYYPCDSMHEYVIGNVKENSVVEIWNGEKLNYLRTLKNKDFGGCASCDKRPWCKVCFASNFNATGDLFQHHPNACVLAGIMREVYGKQLKDGNLPSSM